MDWYRDSFTASSGILTSTWGKTFTESQATCRPKHMCQTCGPTCRSTLGRKKDCIVLEKSRSLKILKCQPNISPENDLEDMKFTDNMKKRDRSWRCVWILCCSFDREGPQGTTHFPRSHVHGTHFFAWLESGTPSSVPKRVSHPTTQSYLPHKLQQRLPPADHSARQ